MRRAFWWTLGVAACGDPAAAPATTDTADSGSEARDTRVDDADTALPDSAEMDATAASDADDVDVGGECPDTVASDVADDPWDVTSSLAPCECYDCENPGAPYAPCPSGERCDAGVPPYVSWDFGRYQTPPVTSGRCRRLCRRYDWPEERFPYCNVSASETAHDCHADESCQRFDYHFFKFERPYQFSYGLCVSADLP